MTPDVVAGLRSELLGDEGNVLHVYDDKTGKPIAKGSIVQGNPTIGIGRNLTARGISEAESESLLMNDLTQIESDLSPLLPWLATTSRGRQITIYSLYFNTSLGNPKHFLAEWPNFLNQVKTGQFEAAASNLLTSHPWVDDVGPGRSTRLANLIKYG